MGQKQPSRESRLFQYIASNATYLFIDLAREPGINYNARQPDTGRTLIIEACIKDNRKIVEFLLEKGASPEIRDRTGRNAYKYCNTEQYQDLFGIKDY